MVIRGHPAIFTDMSETYVQQRERLVSIRDARHELGDISHTMIYRLMKDGDLVRVNIGRRAFITGTSLDAYIQRIIGGVE